MTEKNSGTGGEPEGKRENEIPEENNTGLSFLESVEGLAMRQRETIQQESPLRSPDLNDLSAEDYSPAETSSKAAKKIEELKLIINSIEARPVPAEEIRLNREFRIAYEMELNRAQLEAVTSVKGPVLVIAGAGSGKTRVIVYRVAYMIENGIDPGEILLLTFTRKAAAEMLGRVQHLLRDNSPRKVFGGTFHAFSNFILRKYSGMLGLPPGFTIIDEEDSADTIDLIRSELKIERKEKAFPRKHRIRDIISSTRNRNLTIREVIGDEFTGLRDFISEIELISLGYAKYKKICRIFDYDDLMDVLRDSLRDNPSFRRRMQEEYRYIMVDEYQDTNVVQKEIVGLLAEAGRNLLVVGDDSQSIYSFRGANYENILRFPQSYPDCRVIKIEENYRSNQNILDFTNEIIRNSLIGYRKKLFSRISAACLPLVRKLYDQQEEAAFIADRIMEYRESGIAMNQVAILVRAFWHARYIEAELNRRNIPYVAVGGLRFNERKHIKDVISYLRIILNPYDAVAWHRVLKYIPGVGTATAKRIIESISRERAQGKHYGGGSRYSADLDSLMAMISRAREANLTVAAMIAIVMDYYLPVLPTREYDWQVRILDINVLTELSAKYDTAEKFLAEFALDPPSRNFGTGTVALIDESEDLPLTISTIHSAKGLEWHSVIIPHALDGLIPSARSLKNIEEAEEERRLFYVACSRAKHDLIITMPSFVTLYDAFLSYPSRFIAEINRDKFNYR